MSLKIFHIFFILCSIGLIGGLGVWQLNHYGQSGLFSALLLGAGFLAGAAGLVVYLFWFLKKTKKKV